MEKFRANKTAIQRYEELGLSDALGRHYDYSGACYELSLIVKIAYSKLPKPLQSLVFRDILSAFRLLPQMRTQKAIKAANLLVQAVEASLPKQKKSMAVSEFKRAMVEHKRQGKAHQAHRDGGSMQLPQDILVHLFNFLDLRSLAHASSVCCAWNSAAVDNTLWRRQYSLLFGDDDAKNDMETYKFFHDIKEVGPYRYSKGKNGGAQIDWREAFKAQYKGMSRKFASDRVICGHCHCIIWLSHLTNSRLHHCAKQGNQRVKVNPVSPNKVVDYLLDETTSSSDSDDDIDYDHPIIHPLHGLTRLWAPPRLLEITSSKH